MRTWLLWLTMVRLGRGQCKGTLPAPLRWSLEFAYKWPPISTFSLFLLFTPAFLPSPLPPTSSTVFSKPPKPTRVVGLGVENPMRHPLVFYEVKASPFSSFPTFVCLFGCYVCMFVPLRYFFHVQLCVRIILSVGSSRLHEYKNRYVFFTVGAFVDAHIWQIWCNSCYASHFWLLCVEFDSSYVDIQCLCL